VFLDQHQVVEAILVIEEVLRNL